MSKEKNVPRLRFPEFTDAWEQRKVGELVKDHNAGIYISKENYGEGINVIGVGNIYDNDIFDGEIYRLGPVNDDKFLLDEGDLIYGESSLVLEGIARTVCVGKNGAGSAFAWHTRRVKLDNDFVDSHFATLELNYHPVVRKYLMSVATQTALTGMTTDGYFSATLFLPSVPEQKKISEVFKSLDNLITLHQRKSEALSEYKQGMLQKMFPKVGEDRPEIRFPGFTDAWEQRKLGDMLDRYEDPVETPHDGYERIGIRSHAKGVFHSYVEPGKELDTAKMHRVAADKFILNITFAWEHAVAITEEEDAGTLVSHRFPQFSFHKDLKSHFFKFLMLDRKFREYLELCSPGGAGRNRVLNINDMLKYKINVPSVEEQTKIGEYFDNLDNLITLHRRKCEELNEYKRGLLQQMFV